MIDRRMLLMALATSGSLAGSAGRKVDNVCDD